MVLFEKSLDTRAEIQIPNGFSKNISSKAYRDIYSSLLFLN